MTYEAFHLALKEVTHPSGVPINLEIPYNRLVTEGLLYLQKWVHCLQEKNTDVYEFCDSVLSCGASVVSALVGRIRRVYTTSVDYCDAVDYRQMSYEALLCEARKVKYGASPPAGFAYGLPRPFYATYYGGVVNAETDTECGRSNFGFYAIHNQRIYLAPFLDSSEVLSVEWTGLKRSYGDDDVITDDPEVFRAVKLYITKEMALAYEHDETIYAGATREFQEALADLIHECQEQTRVRESGVCDTPPDCGCP